MAGAGRAISWVLANVKILSKALGISERTARRRIADLPGAVRTARGWVAPVTVKQYAAGAGVSERTARRRAVAVAPSATDPRVKAAMPTGMPEGGQVRHTRVDQRPRIPGRRFEYQGYAWLRRITSGDVFQFFTAVMFSSVKLTAARLRTLVKAEVERTFKSTSPVRIMSIGLVYARELTG